MNIDNLWDNFLEKIKPKISSLSYDTWFKNTKLISLDNNVAKILVESPLQKKSLQETWYQTISDVFSEITNLENKIHPCSPSLSWSEGEQTL